MSFWLHNVQTEKKVLSIHPLIIRSRPETTFLLQIEILNVCKPALQQHWLPFYSHNIIASLIVTYCTLYVLRRWVYENCSISIHCILVHVLFLQWLWYLLLYRIPNLYIFYLKFWTVTNKLIIFWAYLHD